MSKNRSFVVKFDGPAITDHTIPFKTLANVLDGIQNTFHAMMQSLIRREKLENW